MDRSLGLSCSVVSKSLRLHGLWPSSLLCPWDSPGKNTGVGCHLCLQGIFLTQGSNPGLLHCRRMLYRLSYQGSPSWLLESVKVQLVTRLVGKAKKNGTAESKVTLLCGLGRKWSTSAGSSLSVVSGRSSPFLESAFPRGFIRALSLKSSVEWIFRSLVMSVFARGNLSLTMSTLAYYSCVGC